MWANFDKTNFPKVVITLTGAIDEESFNHFITEWNSLIQNNENYYFIFETEKCEYVNINYLFKMAAFIKKIKALPEQKLQRSIIIIKNKALRTLLKLLFSVQSPTADVYVCNNSEEAYMIDTIIKSNGTIPKSISVYKSKS